MEAEKKWGVSVILIPLYSFFNDCIFNYYIYVFEWLYKKKDGFITVSRTSSRNGL